MSTAAIFGLNKSFEITRENDNDLLKKLKPYDFRYLMTIQSSDERCKQKY